MKKLLYAASTTAGLAIAAVSFMPGSASAHSYNYGNNSHDASWQSDDNSNNSGKCDRLADRLTKLNAKFDQENDNRLDKTQRVIDRANDNECQANGTIVDALVKNGNFTTLVAAVKASNLVDALSAPGDKTVFAPTDQAFAKLPAGTVEALLADIPTLTNILTYHVVDGAVDAEAAQELSEATALNGKTLNISVEDGSLYVNDSKVVLSDIQTTNGIVHVIDTVLMPPTE
jgi:uncharacterized surface protein with fasciclin (FAS1) repeats